ncbi:MAG TPA: class I SAM-dependent methyltransferase [Gemmataceae bacterium]|jgi:ubiquinone/menaquinone biosynthesis C-methylase UbiE|nr:class I SAM-dependent methyltransferase [Gemmataceae bacterium]
MSRPFLAKYRRQLLSTATGNILEIGFGTGLNLPFYPGHVHQITIVDPNVGMNRLAQKRISQTTIEVDQRILSGERLPFGDNTFDSVVSTFTLCSIKDVHQALKEVYRVLQPGGRFLFLEHGISPDSKVQKWQRRLNRLQMLLAEGCWLDRNIRALVVSQPYSSVEIEEFYMEKSPKTHGYLYSGNAAK